jgi:hypothetical protein
LIPKTTKKKEKQQFKYPKNSKILEQNGSSIKKLSTPKINPATWVSNQTRFGHNEGIYMLKIMQRSII